MQEVIDAVKAGAQLQRQKDTKELQGHRVYKKGKEAGMRYMKQPMIKDAIEQDANSIWANPVNTLTRLGLDNFKGKVKLIIIKQEEE